ncbi:MAG: cellulase family glycosylhydrolase [Bacteroidetes bacterium]|nr:cellulase family glycosylhydrolase [Bacteroidota bacterium]
MKIVKITITRQFFVQTWRAASLLCALALTTFAANAQTGMTAQKWVENVKIGWNLGNTLDTFLEGNEDECDGDPLCYEALWGNPVTTKAMITALKEAGFNAIRIPATWHKAADEDFNIAPEWMARVTQVVDYAVENDMYIVLNSHHDNEIFKFTEAEKEQSLYAFQKIWEQIADNFKDYNEKLVFEALNEPRTLGSANEWSGGTAEEQRVVNEHYQVFVDVVRASGGNNSNKRILLINPYGANAFDDGMNGLELPTDVVPNKLIVSFHNYAPYQFCFNPEEYSESTWHRTVYETMYITYPIENYFAKFVSNGIPVIIGEFGAHNKNNEAARADWADFYVKYAAYRGIKCFWWDNGLATTTENEELFGLFDRNNLTFYFPEIASALFGTYSVTAVETWRAASLQVYPNPTTGIVNTSEPSEIQVYNSFGALIITTFGTQVDLSNFANGVYFIQANGKRTTVVKK